MDDKEIVSALRLRLADKVGKERFDLWFGPTTRLGVRGEALSIDVPSRFVQDWMRAHFRKELEAACVDTLGRAMTVEFRVDPALSAASEQQRSASGTGPRVLKLGEPHVAGRPAERPSDAPISRRTFAEFHQVVAGHSNRLALASAQMVANKPGCLSPLVIYGPTGVGKTLLLEGVWSAFRASHRTASALFLSAEQFTTHFLEALRGSGLPNFRRKYRGVELLILEDIQFFAGKRATLIELLHTIDTLLQQGKQIVLSCDRPPATLNELGGELTTRLAGGMVCAVDRPDHAMRLGIVQLLAAKSGLNLTEDVQQYVATHLTSHARELMGAVNRLHATSQSLRQPITRALAEEALSEMVRHGGKVLKLSDIEKAVCDVFGLEPQSLQSDRKAKTISHPRMLAMFLARKHTRAALSEIGQFFGRRSHSTVISAQKTVGHWVADRAPLTLRDKTWNIEDAIRHVEETLRAG